MAQFKVFQFQLNDEDDALVNAKGWDASPKLKAYMNVRFGKWAPVAHKYYDLVAEIEAETLDQVFDIGNIGPESAITRKAPMHSVSVGDIIMNEEGDMHLVASIGFTKI
jgi:hypothetical protein